MTRARFPYGPATVLDQARLLSGEIATDVSEHRIRVGDGVTPGGVATARKDEVQALEARTDLVEEQVIGAGTTLVVNTRADLAGIPDPTTGMRAEVRKDPAGDVPNGNGVYRYTGSAWQWLDSLVPAALLDKMADAAEAAATAALADSQYDRPSPEASVSLTSEDDDVLAHFGRTRSVILDRETILTPAVIPEDVHTDQAGNLAPPPHGDERQRNRQARRQMNPRALHHWRRISARVRCGERQRVLLIGDSTMAGQNTGSGAGGYVGARSMSWPTRLAQVLSGHGLNASSESWMGGGNAELSVTQAQYDPRLSFGAGWTRTGESTAGGRIYSSSGAVTELTFTPDTAWDRASIWVAGVSGEFEVRAGETLIATVPAESASSFVRVDVSASAADVMGLRVRPTSTSAVRIVGMEAWDSTRPTLDIINAGWAGSTSTDWTGAGAPTAPFNALHALDCDGAVIVLGINDWITYYYNQSSYITPAQMTTNLRSLVERASRGGSRAVALGTQMLSQPNELVTATHMAAYVEATRDLASQLDLPLIDVAQAFGPWSEANHFGWAEDGVHYNRTAQADIAAQFAVLFS